MPDTDSTDASTPRKLEFSPLQGAKGAKGAKGAQGAMEAPAYGIVFKGIALAVLGLAGLWVMQMQHVQALAPQGQIRATGVGWLWLPWGLMAYTVWFVITGTTRLSSTSLEQSWMWPKRIDLDKLAYAKVIRLRGFEWLMAPRLYTRSLGGKLFIFYAADPAMLDEFKRLEQALAAVRNPR